MVNSDVTIKCVSCILRSHWLFFHWTELSCDSVIPYIYLIMTGKKSVFAHISVILDLLAFEARLTFFLDKHTFNYQLLTFWVIVVSVVFCGKWGTIVLACVLLCCQQVMQCI